MYHKYYGVKLYVLKNVEWLLWATRVLLNAPNARHILEA
jgi:hypothetical protein